MLSLMGNKSRWNRSLLLCLQQRRVLALFSTAYFFHSLHSCRDCAYKIFSQCIVWFYLGLLPLSYFSVTRGCLPSCIVIWFYSIYQLSCRCIDPPWSCDSFWFWINHHEFLFQLWASVTSLMSQILAEEISFQMRYCLLIWDKNWSTARLLSLTRYFGTCPASLTDQKAHII